MKIFAAFFFALVFSGFCLAQNSPTPKTHEVSVVFAGYEIRDDRNKQPVETAVPYVQQTDNSSYGSQPPRDNIQYIRQRVLPLYSSGAQYFARVSFKNNTQKKVASIEYDFVITRNASGKELKRYSLKNKSGIKANETKFLTNSISGSEFEFRSNAPSSAISLKAEVKRVTYKDGSVWIP